MDELQRLQTGYFTLSGGEPFLYPYWRELIDHINHGGNGTQCVSAITNGYLLSEDDIRFLKDRNLSNLGVSLDGNEDVHDFIRATPGSFRRVMKVVRLCVAHGVRIGLVTSFNKYNFEIREEIREIVLRSGANSWQVQIVNAFGRAGENRKRMLLDKAEYLQLIRDVSRWKRSQPSSLTIYAADSLGYCDPITEELLEGESWYGCSAGLYNIAIEADGKVKGCLSLQSDDFVEGNIRERSLIDIWFDDNAFSYTRKYDPAAMRGFCKRCDSAQRCRGGCLGIAHSISGTIFENTYCYKRIAAESVRL